MIYEVEKIVNQLITCIVKPGALLISRRISGIKSKDTVSNHNVSGGVFGDKEVPYKPHGYWGWGKIMMVII